MTLQVQLWTGDYFMTNSAAHAPAGTGQSRDPVELEAFFAIAERWALSTDEQIRLLGFAGTLDLFQMEKGGGHASS